MVLLVVFLITLTCVEFVHSANDELRPALLQDVNHLPENTLKFNAKRNTTLRFFKADNESPKRLEYKRSSVSPQTFVCVNRDVDDKPFHRRLSSQVQLWTSEDIGCWIQQLDLDADVVQRFKENRVDGDLLLVMSENNLINDVRMTNEIKRMRFIRELDELRKNSDYSLTDDTRLNEFLTDIHPDLSRYTYRMLKSLVTLPTLPLLTAGDLEKDCGVDNGFHRKLILNAAKDIGESLQRFIGITALRETCDINCQTGGVLRTTIKYVEFHESFKISFESPDLQDSPVKTLPGESFDSFISYRREDGSLLATLIKELLEKRGQNVFLDVDELTVGRFDQHLLDGISRSRNFILVLSPASLDRCKGDDNGDDWLHKMLKYALPKRKILKCIILEDRWEIVAAMKGNNTIILVIHPDFKPPKDLELPEDMRLILMYEGVIWNHVHYKSCIEKLLRLMNDKYNT